MKYIKITTSYGKEYYVPYTEELQEAGTITDFCNGLTKLNFIYCESIFTKGIDYEKRKPRYIRTSSIVEIELID